MQPQKRSTIVDDLEYEYDFQRGDEDEVEDADEGGSSSEDDDKAVGGSKRNKKKNKKKNKNKKGNRAQVSRLYSQIPNLSRFSLLLYRVGLVVGYMDWVDFYCGHYTVCQVLLGQMEIWLICWARWRSTQVKVNPTQITDHHPQPVVFEPFLEWRETLYPNCQN